MGIKTEIIYDENKMALKQPDYKSIWVRKDAYSCSLIQTRNGEEIHLINFNSTSSYKRAKKWLKLSKRKFLYKMYKSCGLITLIKFLID